MEASFKISHLRGKLIVSIVLSFMTSSLIYSSPELVFKSAYLDYSSGNAGSPINLSFPIANLRLSNTSKVRYWVV